jgi:hypothetical protein
MWMDYRIDLDPKHQVLRATITAAVLTHELAEDCYRSVALIASRGGPYAAIFDLSGVTSATVSANNVRSRALSLPAVPGDRIRVLVAKEPVVFGVSRMFELSRDSMSGLLQVVHSLEEAYQIVGVRPEDFTKELLPEHLVA